MSNVLPKHTFWYHTVGEIIYIGHQISMDRNQAK